MTKVPVTINEILLRGCTLKNSGRAYGVVVYTGPESRIQMNAAEPPRKVGKLTLPIDLHRLCFIMSPESTEFPFHCSATHGMAGILVLPLILAVAESSLCYSYHIFFRTQTPRDGSSV